MGETHRGTSLEQDPRWKDKQKKLMSQMKFPPSFNTKVSMKKIKMDHIKAWVIQRLVLALGIEDEVLSGLVFNHLEVEKPDPKVLQLELSAFMGKQAAPFMAELWDLLISAQNCGGIPREFLAQAKAEIQAQQAKMEQFQNELQKKLKQDDETNTHKSHHNESHKHSRSRSGSRERNRPAKRVNTGWEVLF